MQAIRSLGLAALWVLATPVALAGPVQEQDAATPAPQPAPPLAPNRQPELLSYRFAPATPQTLEQARGGSGGIASDTRLQGETSANVAANIVTGNNVIQASSFANAAGLPVVIQNSGANVLIQNATVINLQFQ